MIIGDVDLNTFYETNNMIVGYVETLDSSAMSAYHTPAFGWFFIISISLAGDEASRIVQLAIQAYGEYGTSKGGDTYVRSCHDNKWVSWRKVTVDS